MKMNAVYILIGLILGLVACSCLGKTREAFHNSRVESDKHHKHHGHKKELPPDSAGSMRMPGQEDEKDQVNAVNDDEYEDHNGGKYTVLTLEILPVQHSQGIPGSQIPRQ